MAIKEYDNNYAVSMASEPYIGFMSSAMAHKKTSHKDSMSVDEYFEKVKKALDKRYENL